MPATQPAGNGSIHVEIDPTIALPERYVGQDEDGPRYEAMSLYEAIVQTAATNLIAQALTKDGLKEGYQSLVDRVKLVRDEEIREAVAPLIEDALSGPLRRTNTYGEPVGKEVTLRELIAEQVTTELKNPEQRGSHRGTVLQAVVRDEVGRALKAELEEALAAGKLELLNVLRAQGTAVIEDALKRAMPL